MGKIIMAASPLGGFVAAIAGNGLGLFVDQFRSSKDHWEVRNSHAGKPVPTDMENDWDKLGLPLSKQGR